jgi:hypothetical protein
VASWPSSCFRVSRFASSALTSLRTKAFTTAKSATVTLKKFSEMGKEGHPSVQNSSAVSTLVEHLV